jgi:hypothetical protein
MNERHPIDPTPELPDDTPIENVRFPTRLRNALATAGLKTVGEVRETPDKTLLSVQDLGPEFASSKDVGPAIVRWCQAELIRIVPELTRAAGIQLNERVLLQRRVVALLASQMHAEID